MNTSFRKPEHMLTLYIYFDIPTLEQFSRMLDFLLNFLLYMAYTHLKSNEQEKY